MDDSKEVYVLRSAEDVYETLVETSDDAWIFGLVAFAILEEERIEWLNHYSKRFGTLPSRKEAMAWYEQLPPETTLVRIKAKAEQSLQAYSDRVLEQVREEERAEVRESVLVSEIRMGRRLLPQFATGVIASVFGSIIFAALLIGAAYLVFSDTSPVEIGRALSDGEVHGEEHRKE